MYNIYIYIEREREERERERERYGCEANGIRLGCQARVQVLE